MPIPPTTLRIGLAALSASDKVGTFRLNQITGGPDALLHWLEQQLGLIAPPVPRTSRVTELASRLDQSGDLCFAPSLETDRWATASWLLDRHDELRMAGWDGQPTPKGGAGGVLPRIVEDLGRAIAGGPLVLSGPFSRLARVAAALEAGQQLPPHVCHLEDSSGAWPAAWQPVLSRMSLQNAAMPEPSAPDGTALRSAQKQVLSGNSERCNPDETLREVSTHSVTAACEFVAAILSGDQQAMPETVICVSDDSVALRLDGCLQRLGLPTMGVQATSVAHPVLQVLPLALALCWEPVDPQVLLDFLSLPISPLPPRVARPLINSLTRQPGLGSAAWEEAVAEICHPEQDPEGRNRDRIDQWLHGNRTLRSESISSATIMSRCHLVAQWAAGRAAMITEAEGETKQLLAQALRIAAGQAAVLGELVQCQGATISEPQLEHLVYEATSTGVVVAPCPECAGGPVRVRSLSEIQAGCRRVLWLGIGGEDPRRSPWPAAELQQIRDCGIQLDDGRLGLAALRSAEVRGLARIEESLLAIRLPQDAERPTHPIWLSIEASWSRSSPRPILDDLFASGNTSDLKPFRFQVRREVPRSPPCQYPLWEITPGLLTEREQVSASEMQDRLGCPLKWVFNYSARLKPGTLVGLPGDFQLKGLFCHSVLERVFGEGGPLLKPQEARDQTGKVFDQRIALDAAPLAQPEHARTRRRLRNEITKAAELLVSVLGSAGYTIGAIEAGVEGKVLGKQLIGSIDCLAVRNGTDEAIIDFKYAGRDKYRRLISEGRAVQLAVYAYSRRSETGRLPPVAYLVLSENQLLTPSANPLSSDAPTEVVDAPPIADVWNRFHEALQEANDWLSGKVPIPARPLQSPDQWPQGVDLILDKTLRAGKAQETCRYCRYGMLCGQQGVE
jgi:hypothetical protein